MQNVAGTRTCTDFVELPSLLMEVMLRDPEMLSCHMTHHSTEAKLSPEYFRRYLMSLNRYKGLDTAHQLFLAALDQKYHSAAAQEFSYSNTNIYDQRQNDLFRSSQMLREIEQQYRHPNLRYPCHTAFQTRFTHLVSYGATYYSYLWCRYMAEKVYEGAFPEGKLTREGGDLIQKQLLGPGGAQDKWKALKNVVGENATFHRYYSRL